MPNTYTLKAIKEFNCIGIDCESSCCKRNWNIYIEPEMLTRWENIENAGMKSRLLNSIKVRMENGTSISNINFNANGNCPLLDGQDRCGIQTTLGAEYQPSACRSYPRVTYKSATTTIKSATLSCPEIARLVIENTDSNIFIEGDVNDVNLNQIGNGEDSLENYLDKWSRLVMQVGDMPVSVKLYYIGKVINDLNTFSEKKGLDEQTVTDICNNYQDHLSTILTAVDNKKLAVDPVSAGWFWDIIYNFSKKTFTALSKHCDLVDPILALNIPLQKKSEQDFKTLYAQVNRLLAETRPLFADLQPGLNQYLRTLFINMGFPWNPIGGNFIASYIKSVFHFASTWYLLALIAQAKGSLEPQDLTRVIYHVEQDYFHNPRVANAMKKNPALFNIENYLSSLLDLH